MIMPPISDLTVLDDTLQPYHSGITEHLIMIARHPHDLDRGNRPALFSSPDKQFHAWMMVSSVS